MAFAKSIVTFLLASALTSSIVLAAPSPAMQAQSQAYLSEQALLEIQNRAEEIAGVDEGCSKTSKACDWMARVPDNTLLIHMSLPGTHDTSTWNYTDARQADLLRYTGPMPAPAFAYRCQEHSLLQSLNEGIRVFDLRVAYNPGNDTLGFWHSRALLAPTTRVEDVFFALYSWLDKHPTEAVLVSINHEGGTGTPEDSAFYVKLYNILNAPVAEKYWVQTNGTLGTLGEARGKLTLLQRFSYNLLPTDLTKRIGIPLDPQHWTDNGKSIELTYNVAKNQIAYIEDFYNINTLPPSAPVSTFIETKYDAITTHLTDAINKNLHPDQLYISFASAAYTADRPTVNPRIFALGDGQTKGINERLLSWLQANKGGRFGIIMFDFYDAVPGLVEAAIGL